MNRALFSSAVMVVLFLGTALFPGESEALPITIVDLGNSVVDTSTGREWLNLTESAGCSFFVYSKDFACGPTPTSWQSAGWTLATESDVLQLFANSAITSSYTNNLGEPDRTNALQLIALLGPTRDDPDFFQLSGISSTLTVPDPLGTGNIFPTITNWITSPNRSIQPGQVGVIRGTSGNQTSGGSLWLYRTVPEPATLGLFGIGLFALAFIGRKKASILG